MGPFGTWRSDSGASNHVTGNKDYFITNTETRSQQLEVANGPRLEVRGKGIVEVPGTNGFRLADAWYAPGITRVVSFAVMTDLIANSETQPGLYTRPLAVHQQERGWRPPRSADMKPGATRSSVLQLTSKCQLQQTAT